MKQEKNIVWAFFSSVKLALFTLLILAGASIFGTVIPQNESFGFYSGRFGASWAKVIHICSLDNMYNSWWFLFILGLFSMNLIICTIERFPGIWRLVTMDNLQTTPERLMKIGHRRIFFTSQSQADAGAAVGRLLSGAGWKATQAATEDGQLFFAQKGGWTRLGVIVVHVSILVIFAGAIIGSLTGWKASIYIPEGSFTKNVYSFSKNHEAIDLGFQVACDKFEVSYYKNGAPKDYRSELVVFDAKGKEQLRKSIEVNDPLNYRGITFYQSSFQPAGDEYLIHLINNKTKVEQRFIVSAGQDVKWPRENVTFNIINKAAARRSDMVSYQIRFGLGELAPVIFWTKDNTTYTVKPPEAEYSFFIKERFATGLQVAKDPGVWFVYIGCILMILGLIIAFFLSHRRIWIHVCREGERTRILLAGVSNKNKIGFEKDFALLTAQVEQNEKLNLMKDAS